MKEKAILVLIRIFLIAILYPFVGFPQPNIQSVGRSHEVLPARDVISDFSWIILLCVFSFVARYKKGRYTRLRLLGLVILLLMLAALHSHPLWSFTKLNRGSTQVGSIAHLTNTPAAVLETGLEIDDIVHAMCFDPGGNLWISANNSGPYIYSLSTNELTTLLRPDNVYGLFPDAMGMWVLTSNGAFLYQEETPVKIIRFPEEVIPLSGGLLEKDIYFGTTKGLYRAGFSDTIALHEALDVRVNQILQHQQELLLATEDGVWRVNQNRAVETFCKMPPRFSAYSIAESGSRLLAATSSNGIWMYEKSGWKRVQFARKSLNMFSPGAAAIDGNIPFFGTMEGSLIFFLNGEWRRVQTGEWAITAIAIKENFVYAWTNGKLLRIKL
jgi:hypothetical protein